MSSKILLSAFASLFIATLTQAQNLPTYLPSDGLVAWWPFNGNANDESGNGNDGTVNGATLTEDRFGEVNNAYYFNGLSNIQTPSINVNQSLTLSAWLKAEAPAGVNNSFNYSAAIIDHNSETSSNNGYAMYYHNTFGYGLYAQTSYSGNLEPTIISYQNIQLNIWKHCTFTFDMGIGKLFIDGILVATDFNMDSIIQSNTNVFFGKSPWANDGNLLLGSLDDIAIYNRALSQEEITALYTGEPINPPSTCNPLPANLQNGLVGYWPFCGNANDESGNGNDGTVNGATLTEDRFGVANAAYDFDGVNDFISVPNSNSIDITGTQITIAYWCKFSNNSLDSNYKGVSKGGWDTDGGYELIFRNGDDSGAIYLNGTLGGCRTMNINNYINQWFNVAATFDGVTAKIYIDGNLMPTTSGGIGLTSFFSSAQYPLFFGTRETANSLSGYLLGQLDDIGIWNRALTADEVQQLYTLNACTFTIYDTVTVTQTVYDTVSVSVSTTDTLIINTLITAVQPAQENTFLVYPNPAGSQITINNGNVGILGGYTMRISNSAGQEVYNQNITQNEVTLDLGAWGGNGLYVLYIVDPQGEIIAVKQIVLQ